MWQNGGQRLRFYAKRETHAENKLIFAPDYSERQKTVANPLCDFSAPARANPPSPPFNKG
jgi:hypothetical protein